ncbi:aldo/keto reductase [Flavobacterium caeni]|uniref:Predicted oxidoreductase n=1 Tax=Flavobacterium caeni TaxID=490189 RepID=A0A1G5E628_9FLAO|nr:aldo/keto reductase [Flavobacterium caeni]SCY22436.1 Predicted oxidoreductase [Flavobacterium caeni]
MEHRKLGQSGLQIAPVVFGGNVFGWTIDERQSFDLLNHFTEAGCNAIDTADVYSRWAPGNVGGESEIIIGKWMKEKKNRHNIVLMTKVGSDMGDGKKGLRKAYIVKAAEDSLRRLQTDYIDLYQTHFDQESTPVSETLEAYDQLIKDGKVRVIGASNMSPERLQESLDTSRDHHLPIYQTLQPHYNLYARQGFEDAYEPIVMNNQLGVITYYSLESGFLTGKYRKHADIIKSPRGGKMDNYLNDRGFAILAALDDISKRYQSTPAAVALAWLIHRESVTAPIVSATSLLQLDSIVQAPSLKLEADAIAVLDIASAY